MSVRDIARHLDRSMGIEVSHDTISRITDEVLEEMRAWQVRPLEAIYPVVFVDALVAKVRDGSSVRNKAAATHTPSVAQQKGPRRNCRWQSRLA